MKNQQILKETIYTLLYSPFVNIFEKWHCIKYISVGKGEMKRWMNCCHSESFCSYGMNVAFAAGSICIKSILHNEEEAIEAKLLKKTNKQWLKGQVKIGCFQEMFLSSRMQKSRKGAARGCSGIRNFQKAKWRVICHTVKVTEVWIMKAPLKYYTLSPSGEVSAWSDSQT